MRRGQTLDCGEPSAGSNTTQDDRKRSLRQGVRETQRLRATGATRFDHDDALTDQDLEFLLGSILRTSLGDVNLDGRFNSADLVIVFRAGEYEDQRSQNSTWSRGDWNCDGEFNTADLVAAWTAGRYRPN